MTIDIRTLFLILALNCTLVGIVFVASWYRGSEGTTSLRAGIGALFVAAGAALLLLRGIAPDRVSIDLANSLVLTGLGAGWSAVRHFVGRPAPLWRVLAGTAVWAAACAIPAFHAEIAYRNAFLAAIAATYTFAAAYELLRSRPEHSRSGRAIGFLCLGHGVVVSLRFAHALLADSPASIFDGGVVHSLFMAEPVLMIFAFSLLGVRLVRERAETELRRTAETDALTGVLNRRAFFAGAAHRVAQAQAAGRPVGLLVFDLDHFKAVNDRHGHIAGDMALGGFARVVGRAIRSSDLVGRIGGEEFATLLDGVDEKTAAVIAERIRVDFATLGIEHEGVAVPATVSAGIAVGRGPAGNLHSLFAAADRALYEAKRAGRDRVHSALVLASQGATWNAIALRPTAGS